MRLVAATEDRVITGRTDGPRRVPALLLHETPPSTGTAFFRILDAVGKVVAAPHLSYGSNDDRLDELLPGRKALVSYGASSLDALHYAIHNPGTVTCVTCIEPEFDTSDLYNSDTPHRPGIEEAWGITYPTPLPPGANPRGVLSRLRVPVRIYAPYIPDEYAETARVEHLRSLDPGDLASWIRQHSA